MPPRSPAGPGRKKASEPQEELAAVGQTVLSLDTVAVEHSCVIWGRLACDNMERAAYAAIHSLFELSSLKGCMVLEDLTNPPEYCLKNIPSYLARDDVKKDLETGYQLHAPSKTQKKAIDCYERFWSSALKQQSCSVLIKNGLLNMLCLWLAGVMKAVHRPLRHAAVVAAWAVLETLTDHHQHLEKNSSALAAQAEAMTNEKKATKLKDEVVNLNAQKSEVQTLRSKLFDACLSRCSDVCEIIRTHSLGQLEKLTRQEPIVFLQRTTMDMVLQRTRDEPSAEVRMRAMKLIHTWFDRYPSAPQEVQELLAQFADDKLVEILGQMHDVDQRVAIATLRCVSAAALAERMADDMFEKVVSLCFLGDDRAIREEAALFVNKHVFQDPGICVLDLLNGKQGRLDFSGDAESGMSSGTSLAKALNSEVCISMLVEFLEGYLFDDLRYTDRVVRAFWGKAPCLGHWSTMVTLCLLGEAKGAVVEPINARQRSCILHLLEACVRMADEEARGGRAGLRVSAVPTGTISEACDHILPEITRIFEVCSADEQQMLLVSHVCKLLLDYVAEHPEHQRKINSKAISAELRKAILTQTLIDTLKFCTASLLNLSNCFDEVRVEFSQLASDIGQDCKELLSDIRSNQEQLKLILVRCVVLQNAGLDVGTLGSDMVHLFSNLLQTRARHLQKLKAARASQDTLTLDSEVPDGRLALLVLDLSTVIAAWHIQVVTLLEVARAQESDAMAALVMDGASLVAELMHLREACAEVLEHDRCHYVRAMAFSAYLFVLEFAQKARDRIDFDPALVSVPEAHMRALWCYLNEMYASLSRTDVANLKGFNAKGDMCFGIKDIFPHHAEGDRSLSAQRCLTLKRMEGIDYTQEGEPLEPATRLLFTCISSGAVVDSSLDVILCGPLGALVLTQCERSRPARLREIAAELILKLHLLRPEDQVPGEAFCRVQRDAIMMMRACCGEQAARALSFGFKTQWGTKVRPEAQEGCVRVLSDVVNEVITPTRELLYLLEIFAPWQEGLGSQERLTLNRLVEDRAQACQLRISDEPCLRVFYMHALGVPANPVTAPSPPAHDGKRPADAEEHQQSEAKRPRTDGS
mmetsp:Transcript_10393/g.23506  ORF Transcript_10393/g.23506 Transcript_10393/m.23506 type:complete len:1095 (+) Transcript_10393:153-3437(+)